MKKVLKSCVAWSLVLTMLLTGQMFAFAKTFTDLNERHWAYNYVNELVNEGTINGYDDGSFRPEGTVTRAEFVKMIGEGPTMRDSQYYDVDESHWAYNYIMTSGIKEDGTNKFFPDKAITRGEVMEILWTRSGKLTGTIAPAAITKQYKENTDAIAWAYTYGLMQGDNGIDLRCDDTLTRGEASALIVRSRSITADTAKVDFISAVQPELLETVFESVKIFDNHDYKADQTVTYGEFAKAALRLATNQYVLTYKGYGAVEEYDHKYAKDMYAISRALLGEDMAGKDTIDKEVTMQDGLAMLVFGAVKNAAYPVGYGAKGKYYSDVTGSLTDMEDMMLTYACQNGIRLFAKDTIGASDKITHKDIACIMLQLDRDMGIIKSETSDLSAGINLYKPENIRTDLSTYPANEADYRCILEGIPNQVYSAEITSYGEAKLSRDAVFSFANEYSQIFSAMLESFRYICQKNGADVRFTYYPSMVYDNGDGYTLRVKCEITGSPVNVYMQDMFDGDYGDNYKVYNGMTFYMDVVTGGPVTDIVIDTDKVVVDKMVVIVK